jgi:hypothetical protein
MNRLFFSRFMVEAPGIELDSGVREGFEDFAAKRMMTCFSAGS